MLHLLCYDRINAFFVYARKLFCGGIRKGNSHDGVLSSFFFFLSLIFKQRIVNIILLPIYVHKEMSNSTKKEKREEPE